MNINDLVEGESGVITSCDDYSLMKHGFIEGTTIHIYKKIQSITCIYLRGAVIACRNTDLKSLYINKEENNG